jgi:hypothetical protein
MKNPYAKISIFVAVLLLTPQVAFAAWWNPISWFGGWNFFHRADTQTQVLENRVKELEKKLENTATSTPVIATTTKAVAPAKVKVTETPAPKKVVPVVPVQPVTVSADSQLLIIEKCKAKRDESRGPFWTAFLKMVTLKEQKYQQTVMDVLATSYPPGTVSGSAISEAIKITPAQHEKNLEEVRTLMEAQLAKEYSACLNGN